jgi:DNA adenine methylase
LGVKAPFPWFGGKSRAAHLIWDAFGDTANYVEPFAGSLAVLLARPSAPRIETVNDLDCYIANFWRAVAADPEAVARYADWPVNEADLHARHLWLVRQADFRERMKSEPEFYDAKVAGWWVWGLCSWIGSGWCAALQDNRRPSCQRPHLGTAGQGVNRPSLQLPHLGDAGRGVHRKLPHLGDAGRGLADQFQALSARLRRVRVACGDWTRVLGDSVTHKHGLTAILLDPPYDDGEVEYSAGGAGISQQVREWALANGDNPLLRIALCGYEGEHTMPNGWRCVEWKAKGGYGSQRRNGKNENAARERIWFSPHCLGGKGQQSLFRGAA